MNPQASSVDLAIRDIHLPDSALWWPPAPGWWIVFILLVVIGFGFYIYKKTYFNRKLKKNIKLELSQYYLDFENTSNAQLLIQQLSALLRRVALYRFKELSVAKMQGNEWLEFLDSTLPDEQSKQHLFKTGTGKIFLEGPYQPVIDNDVKPVYELVTLWLDNNLKNKFGFL